MKETLPKPCEHGRLKSQCNECGLQKENDELWARVAKYESVLCQTCQGAGTVLVGVDDGRDCPTCAQSLGDIKAEAIESILNLDFDCETANSDVAYSATTIQDYANQLKEGGV